MVKGHLDQSRKNLRSTTTVCPSAGQNRSLSTPTSILSHSVKIPAFAPIFALPP
jgi:hypothetical protein